LVGQTIQILSTDQKKASARDDCAAPPVKRYGAEHLDFLFGRRRGGILVAMGDRVARRDRRPT
jgi:hypothetical protein